MARHDVLTAMSGSRTNNSTAELFSKSNFAHRTWTQNSSAMEDKGSTTWLHPQQHYASPQSQADSPVPVNRSSLLGPYSTGTVSLHRAHAPAASTTTDSSEFESGISARTLDSMPSKFHKRRHASERAVEHEAEGQTASKRQRLFTNHYRVEPCANVLHGRRLTARNGTPDSSDDEDTASNSVNSVEDAKPLFVSPGLTPTRERSSTISTDKSTAPNTRTMDHQRRLDRAAVKNFIENRIKPSGKNSAWNLADRLSFVMTSYDDKLKEREQAGGSWRSLWPEQYRVWGKKGDTDWLQKTFSGYLLGIPSPAASGQHEDIRDEDDEELVVKREEVEVHEARQNDLEPQLPTSPRSTLTGTSRRRWKTMHRLPRSRSAGNEAYEIHVPSIETRGSTSIPEVVGSEWRQYWEFRNDGDAVLVTPRTWKWNSRGELIAWPPLDQILPPFEPPTQP
ncbi:hypothetical protein CBER1_01580 [Cercospora berteroae]|uniref:Uncharacterized protein n=1 Tax=Cercospora berteroae TaxID=357750 RepID=A0A2S6C7Q5_9PEZI|nr:hypothetical protein CBER1_01580 [Cercospora berteroae]